MSQTRWEPKVRRVRASRQGRRESPLQSLLPFHLMRSVPPYRPLPHQQQEHLRPRGRSRRQRKSRSAALHAGQRLVRRQQKKGQAQRLRPKRRWTRPLRLMPLTSNRQMTMLMLYRPMSLAMHRRPQNQRGRSRRQRKSRSAALHAGQRLVRRQRRLLPEKKRPLGRPLEKQPPERPLLEGNPS